MTGEVRLGEKMAYWAVFVLLAAALTVARLLPLDSEPSALPGPDLLLCLILAWTIRRPDLLPVWITAPVVLLSDLLLMRPPGLWSALVVLATERLRRSQRRLRTISFAVEIGLVGLICAGLVAAHWLVLALLVVGQPPLWTQLLQVPATVLFYPLAVALCRWGLHIRKRPAIEGFGRGARA